MLRAFRTALLSIGAMLLLAMVGVVSLQIVYRYVLDNPLVWTEEAARLIFIWLVFLGSAYAASSSSHLRLDLFGDNAPRRLRSFAALAGGVGAVIYSAIVVYSGWKIVELTASRSLPGTGLSYVWFHAAAPIGAALTLIGTGILLLHRFRSKNSGERS